MSTSGYHICRERKVAVSTTTNRTQSLDQFIAINHNESLALEGLDELFHWASEVVADGQENQNAQDKEKRIRQQVLHLVEQQRREDTAKQVEVEMAYLHRRVIALLQSLVEATQETAALKQQLVMQQALLSKIPELELELAQLKANQVDREVLKRQQSELLDALSRLKRERDYLDELLTASELENDRLKVLFLNAREELNQQKQRRWWRFLFKITSALNLNGLQSRA